MNIRRDNERKRKKIIIINVKKKKVDFDRHKLPT